MKISFILGIMLVLLVSCQGKSDLELAKQYKLELNYYGNSVKFTDLNMTNEASLSCNQTEMLRTECFASLVQTELNKGNDVREEWCDAINPSHRIKMSNNAFNLVYKEIDDTLLEELGEKRWPSKERKEELQEIKDDCNIKFMWQ